MGRPVTLDDLRAKRIIDAIRKGMSRTAAAAKGGIGRTTLMNWLARGRDEEAPYADFLNRVKAAEAEAEAEMVALVRVAALEPKYWQAAAWWLERCRPNDYAKREPTKDDEDARAEGDTGTDLAVAESVLAAIKSRKKPEAA